MGVQATSIMLGVHDIGRAKAFYAEGLDCTVDKDYPNFVSLDLGQGSSSLALYELEAAAQDAGVASDGSGFRGVSFHYVVASSDDVDETINRAINAGGTLVKAPADMPWGGYSGYFADPDGHLWKVAAA